MILGYANPAYYLYERLLKTRILAGEKVEHVAIIQDGNRRFAKRLMVKPWKGHEWGAKKLSNVLETEIKNIFAIGDGAGVSRGLIQASASGVVAAREILKRH